MAFRLGIVGLGMAVAPHAKSLVDLRDRVEVAHGIEGEFFIKTGADRKRSRRQQYRVTVGCRVRREAGADSAGCSAAVVDDELLPERSVELLPKDPSDDIGAARGWKRDDETHRMRRVRRRISVGRAHCGSGFCVAGARGIDPAASGERAGDPQCGAIRS